MKTLPVVAVCVWILTGCVARQDTEVTMMRVRPIELVVEVRGAKERFDSAPDRFEVELAVLKPQSKSGQVVHFVVDGVTESWRQFVVEGTQWKIQCDEEAFDHERSIGFSFWTISALDPVRYEEPNQRAEATRWTRPEIRQARSQSCARSRAPHA